LLDAINEIITDRKGGLVQHFEFSNRLSGERAGAGKVAQQQVFVRQFRTLESIYRNGSVSWETAEGSADSADLRELVSKNFLTCTPGALMLSFESETRRRAFGQMLESPPILRLVKGVEDTLALIETQSLYSKLVVHFQGNQCASFKWSWHGTDCDSIHARMQQTNAEMERLTATFSAVRKD
jgi:hypothetical protein